MNDQQLVAQIKYKNSAALATLYDRYAPFLLGCLCRMATRQEVEPLVEEAFYRLWNEPQTVTENVGRWLLQIACRAGREQGVKLAVRGLFFDYA